jgi:hypothetical protein
MTMERPAGLAETVFLASHLELAGSTQSVMVAEFVDPLPPSAILDGLRMLFCRQPMLRARLCGTAPNWRFVFDTAFDDVEIRTRTMGSDLLDKIFAAECDNILDLTLGPLWRALSITHDGAAVAIVVTFAHAIVDGVSAIAFMRQLLDGAGAAESYLVRPPMEELLPAPPAPIGAAERESSLFEPTGEWPFDDAAQPSQRRTSVVLGRVGPDTLDGLLYRCRAEHVSVDALFVSGILAALAKRIPAALSVPVICAFDARPELDPSVPAEEIGMYMKDLQLFDPEWATHADVWTRARRIRRQMRDRRKWALDHPGTLASAEIHEQIRLAADYPLKSFPFGFSVSNLGRQAVTSGFRSLYLSSTDRIGIMGFQVVLTELRGELFLTFVHADPLVAPTTIATLRDDVIDMVRSASHPDTR